MPTARFRLTAIISALTIALTLLTAAPAQAANATDFNPGNLISDQQFFDGGAMTASDVQTLLSSKVGVCRAGYVCLKDYVMATPSKPTIGACQPYTGAASESAAQIIAKVGAACNISQKAIIILLEKEQSLITDTWPTDRQYRSATGYGCPDTADCNAYYYGFFNQVYSAALQFQYYAANPGRWNHVPGRVNNIRVHPNAGCGTTSVFIENQATAGLYNYTPYAPNTAALSNLYGSGDACSTYGNRNFWRIYVDWFGTAAPANLVKATSDSTVYLISGQQKHRVASASLRDALAPLGAVTLVSDQYLSGLTTAYDAQRIIRDDDGHLYFVDGGRKLHIGTCELAVAYGGSCSAPNYTQMTNGQAALLPSGPAVTNVVTAGWSTFALVDGGRAEILDGISRARAGLSSTTTTLTTGALAGLPLRAPIVRNGTFTRSASGVIHLLANDLRYAVASGSELTFGVRQRTGGHLTDASTRLIPLAGEAFTGALSVYGQAYALTGASRWTVNAGGLNSSVAVPQTFVDSYTDNGTINVGSVVRSGHDPLPYLVAADDVRAVPTSEAVDALGRPTVTIFTTGTMNAFTSGPVALRPGYLVRAPGTPDTFLVNGTVSRVKVTDMGAATAAGFTGMSYATPERLAAYPISGSLSYGADCSGTRYISSGGRLHLIPSNLHNLYPIAYTRLEPLNCRLAEYGSNAINLIRVPSGTVYLLADGLKLRVTTAERLRELEADGPALRVPAGLAKLIPEGGRA